MTRIACGLALAAALGAAANAAGQPGPTPGQNTDRTQSPGGSGAGGPAGGAPAGDGPMVCVRECKPGQKVVYTSVVKTYCAPDYSIGGLLRRCFGSCDECGAGACGACGGCEVRTRTVLVKKVVPGPGVSTCVLGDATVARSPAAPTIKGSSFFTECPPPPRR